MADDPRIPVFLEHYDFLGALETWRDGGDRSGDPTLARWWQLSPGRLDRTVFVCEISWPGERWVLTTVKQAPTVQEAVHLAMLEFNRQTQPPPPETSP